MGDLIALVYGPIAVFQRKTKTFTTSLPSYNALKLTTQEHFSP